MARRSMFKRLIEENWNIDFIKIDFENWQNVDFRHIHILIRCGNSARRKIIVKNALIKSWHSRFYHQILFLKKRSGKNCASLCLYRQRPTMAIFHCCILVNFNRFQFNNNSNLQNVLRSFFRNVKIAVNVTGHRVAPEIQKLKSQNARLWIQSFAQLKLELSDKQI